MSHKQAQIGNKRRTAPLSFAQQRLWFLDQYEPDNILYNIPEAIRLRGALNLTALERSLNEIVKRHESLRTIFTVVNDRPVQVINEARDFRLTVIELRDTSPEKKETTAARLATEEGRKPFNLAEGPLMRIKLLRLAEDDHVLLMTMHHIISDGWSIKVLIRELGELYEAYANGREAALPELPIQYADFAVWQREWLRGERLEQQLSYWRAQLADAPPLLELPTDKPRPTFQTFHGANLLRTFSKKLNEAITQLGRREGATLFMTLLSVFVTLLYRYSGQRDILVGTPIANRNRSDTESLIGFFVNTLVLRTRLSDAMTFRELLRQVRDTALEAYEHQDLPFEKLVEELQPERTLSHTPLFQVMFQLLHAETETLNLSSLSMSQLEVEIQRAKFDLTLSLSESEDGLVATWNYNTDLFDAATIGRMAGPFERLLHAVISNPDKQVSSLQMLSEAERDKVLFEWNDTRTGFHENHPIHLVFAEQARRMPEAIAVRFEQDVLTYGELNRRANRLAHRLRGLGVGPEVSVGLLARRSVGMVVAMLAVLKAGGAYVPLDPDYPRERLASMLEVSRCPVLVSHGVMAEGLAGDEQGRVLVDTTDPTIDSESDSDPADNTDLENPAYIIFTSGSTGTPKGIVIPHRAVNHLVVGADYVELGPSNCVAQASNASFDAATFEVWGALLNGAQLVGLPLDVILSPRDFAEEIRRQRIDTLFLTAALFNQIARELPEAFAPLEHLLFGGEAADPSAVRQVLEKGGPRRLLNVYGPTESTTFASWQLVREVPGAAVTIPIGRPISNTRLYILDLHLQPVPVGVTGELHIAGDGLARGYLDPSLTAERFVPDPFASEPAGRLYKTGDLTRWLPDGQIEFIGRNDFQVKLRGFRIELGEIETVLRKHDGVRDAVVAARTDPRGDAYLTAYVVGSHGSLPSDRELRTFLKEKLPEYMVPSVYLVLDRLPLTSNGKVDRRGLPEPSGAARELDVPFVAPRNAVEEVLCGIFAEVLSVERVGVNDNFFELGGHSLLAAQAVSLVRKAFQSDLPLRKIFEAPTVASLAALLITGEPTPGEFEKRAGTLRSIENLSTNDLEELLRRKKAKAAN
ncbi:MAG TPA: amino acid adenylation domain-containing protein [Pyrinomonadaceae bacterium]|nr:amino acid adenylation domain-containing protein [Pyrinomonadaceae bacterium]